MQFSKYHALGNDYVVVEAAQIGSLLSAKTMRQICAPHFGIGADGVLVREAPQAPDRFRVRIFNSDGSEAEKSGNGLRIFARYLWDAGLVGEEAFTVDTAGGPVTCRIAQGGRTVAVDMGCVTFNSHDVPVTGPPRDVIGEWLTIEGQQLQYSAANIGNPHCVIPRGAISEEETRKLGPLIETEARFPNLTNVQFMQLVDRKNIRIEIWERGTGYTFASGTSSCAAAAVAHRLGLCDSAVTVHMPGGQLAIEIADDYNVRMTGPVVKVADGQMCDEIFSGDKLAAQTSLNREDSTVVPR